MITTPFDVDRLEAGLVGVKWSKPSQLSQNGAHHGYRQSKHLDGLQFVLDRFAPIHSAWLSWIDPGGFVLPHHDAGPYRERWQIPIRPAGEFLEDGERLWQVAGVPFRVRQWLPHQVTNYTTEPRVHLVLDRDVVVKTDPAPFQVL